MTVVETNTWAIDIRDAFFNALDADPYFANYTRRTNKMLPVQHESQIPYLGVYLIDEAMQPDGDANAGCIRFLHTVRIGFSVIQANNDGQALERSVDAAWQHILQRLLCDPKIFNVWQSGNPEGALIEALVRGLRRHVWGTMQARNETPICELEWLISPVYRTEWYPDITDVLSTIDVTVRPNGDNGANEFEIKYENLDKYVQPLTEQTNGQHQHANAERHGQDQGAPATQNPQAAARDSRHPARR